ncbi:penicillin-binding transpeptidase domain-containing protein [Nonomuraea rubra]|uniref:penicillin-binding transpeptidase domain-containing protein n=1 Tax=Nonomuraea rubra TaxID=46180 RepID=UPI003608E265
MAAAKKAVESHLAAVGDKNIHANLAAVDPRNGQVLAFYSGHDYLKSFTNNAFDADKQAASAFKPYVLAAWLEKGYSLRSYVSGNGPVTLPGTKPIGNSHDVGEAVQIDRATAESVNTAFATMAQEVGLEEVAKIAEGAGIDQDDLEQAIDDHAYGMSIGAGLVTPVEQATGYGIFANGGVHHDAHVVLTVKAYTGKTVMKEAGRSKAVISPDTAADATYAMQQVVRYGTARAPRCPAGGRSPARPAPTTRTRRPGSSGTPRSSRRPSGCTRRCRGSTRRRGRSSRTPTATRCGRKYRLATSRGWDAYQDLAGLHGDRDGEQARRGVPRARLRWPAARPGAQADAQADRGSVRRRW